MVDKFDGISREKSWALPAHAHTPTGIAPRRIDLFAAETANCMAELITLFRPVLPSELVARVMERLESDFFMNYLDTALNRPEEVWWMRVSMNWNAVCHQGVVGGALGVEPSPEVLADILLRAREGLPIFLGGFTPDGGCSEGPAYWGYGFGWFCLLNQQLEMRSGGRFSLIEGDPHIAKIAGFGPDMSLAHARLVNFADCAHRGPLSPSLMQYLGDRLGDEKILDRAAENYRLVSEDNFDPDGQRCDLLHLTRLFLHCPEHIPAVQLSGKKYCFYPDLAQLVAGNRDKKGHLWEFAAKAGHNEEHHNHNDCGSYLLNINGTRLVTEIGAPEYVKAFFQLENRYSFLAARTRGHSLPIINGFEQSVGLEAASRIVRLGADDAGILLEIDLTRCYAAESACEECLRTFHWNRLEGFLTVNDRVRVREFHALETAVITESPVSLKDGHALIQDEQVSLCVTPGASTKITDVETHSYSDHQGKAGAIQRIVLQPDRPGLVADLSYRFTLAE